MTKKSNPQEVITLANQGDAQAQYELGLMYELGMGIKKDLNKAFVKTHCHQNNHFHSLF